MIMLLHGTRPIVNRGWKKRVTNAASMAPPTVPELNVKTVEEFLPIFGPAMTRSKSASPGT